MKTKIFLIMALFIINIANTQVDPISLALEAFGKYQGYLEKEEFSKKIDKLVLCEIAAAKEALEMAKHFSLNSALRQQYISLAIISSAKAIDYFKNSNKIGFVDCYDKFYWKLFEANRGMKKVIDSLDDINQINYVLEYFSLPNLPNLDPNISFYYICRMNVDIFIKTQSILYPRITAEFILYQCKKDMGIRYNVQDIDDLYRSQLNLFLSSFSLAYASEQEKIKIKRNLKLYYPSVDNVDSWFDYHNNKSEFLVKDGIFKPGLVLTGDYEQINKNLYASIKDALYMLNIMK